MEINEGIVWIGENLGISLIALALWWIVLISSLWITAQEGNSTKKTIQTLERVESKVDQLITLNTHD